MGANQSAVYASDGTTESFMPKKFASSGANDLFMPKKTGQVLIFHSSSKWKSHFQSSKETNKLMDIHFTATWCGPCRTMEPIIHDFAAKYVGVEFIQIDVDELEGVAREYAVQALPAFILIKKGKSVDKVVGAEKAALQKKIEKYMI
ncbi:putative monodehydroascorbate reductase (NADH) [Heracleum sosnowskyi]|uniref:Monodehydroascorbate reductase (NADH) n=1 Tax=Heracleum sosnowskyi TaxID=360622 RepID=A0AAD8GM19_9APIA|nr:putative monodehydroascorbate reductase (NADH) [Heracleum sosnowskyi]